MVLPSGSVGKESACNAGGPSLIPGSGRSTGEGIGYPLQYSGLENSWTIVHGVTKSWTWLSNFYFHIFLKNNRQNWKRRILAGGNFLLSCYHLWLPLLQIKVILGREDRQDNHDVCTWGWRLCVLGWIGRRMGVRRKIGWYEDFFRVYNIFSSFTKFCLLQVSIFFFRHTLF